jgi:hypothetical protein
MRNITHARTARNAMLTPLITGSKVSSTGTPAM